MPRTRKLAHYRGRRDFQRTPEPVGGRRRARGRPRFVIQQHQARSLHYDFRLEADGVLKSWAVPKGPSTNPRDKRLALRTEDHPLEYADFEGVIPEGQYGAGTVIVWDRGTYRSLRDEPIERQVAEGHVAVWLAGKKLRGGYALTRIGGGKQERWLLVKKNDDAADPRRDPIRSQPESVKSGRMLEDVAPRR
ncbi:MAG: DNA polymerase ligase N-terminal domain-containing protein [Gaiellaceae bacterium]